MAENETTPSARSDPSARMSRRQKRRIKKRLGISNLKVDPDRPHEYAVKRPSFSRLIIACLVPAVSALIIAGAMIWLLTSGRLAL